MAKFGQRGADSDGGYEWPETPLICDTGLEIENDITWGVIGEKSEKKKSVYSEKRSTNSTKNIFSFDLRSKTGSGEHWRDHATLGDRGYVFYEESPHSCKSYLNIEPVQWQAFLYLLFSITNSSPNCASSSAFSFASYKFRPPLPFGHKFRPLCSHFNSNFGPNSSYLQSTFHFAHCRIAGVYIHIIIYCLLSRWRQGTAGSTGAGWTTRSRPPGTPGSSSSS